MDVRHPELLRHEHTVLVVIDVQDKLVPSVSDAAAFERSVVTWLDAAKRLGIPRLLTEQYPKGLGPTLASVRAMAGEGAPPIPKTSFSACGEPGFLEALRASGREQVVLIGLETHVCVAQTALDLLARGWSVFLGLDAVAAGTEAGHRSGLSRMESAGVRLLTVESFAFDVLADARHPAFKSLQELVKAHRKERS